MKQLTGLAVLGLACFLAGLCACAEPQAEKQVVNVDQSNPRTLLAPGKAGTVSGTTLVVPTIPNTVHVYTAPLYAGVESPGEIGIASSAGYDPGERIVLPINVNLGTQQLGSYAITLTVKNPAVLRIVDVDGSYSYLAAYYTAQYQPAAGFETPPKVAIGDTVTTIAATSTSVVPVTGRVNLANVTVDILAPGPLSLTGDTITFTVNALQTKSAADICAALGSCTAYNAIAIENFRIQ
jgi:hypothetical protein